MTWEDYATNDTQKKVTHTQGPWKAMPGPYIADRDGKDLLDSWKPASHPDCLLLAAAPELLAALKKIRSTTVLVTLPNLLHEVNAVIAKAEVK